MKVLQITLNIKGGMVHYTSQISNALSKEAEVYVIGPLGLETKYFNREVNIYQLHTGNIIKNAILNTMLINRAIHFLRTIQKINPDVIHLQSCHPWICLFFPFIRKYKIVTTIHDVNPHTGSRSIDQKISQYLHIKYSDAIIVHGDSAKNILLQKYTGKKIFIVPHGDYSFFTKSLNEEYKEEPGTVLFFGRIIEYKGLEYLIQAVPIIAKHIPNLKVIIAGSGEFKERDHVESSPYFELHNYFIKDEDVGKFFQRASVVVLPYIEGTQTGIIPVAYAFKKPVVVTNVGSIPEVVEDGVTGYLVTPKDVNALASAIVYILSNTIKSKKMGENAYKKMRNELSWNIIAEKTIEVYKKA